MQTSGVQTPWKFKCMRCMHDWTEEYDPQGVMTERSCPKCRSNSVRPLETTEKKE